MAEKRLNKNSLNNLELENIISNAMEIARLGMWEWNLDDDKLYLSDECFEITGFNKEEFDNSFNFIMNRVIHEESRELLMNNLSMAIKKGKMANNVYRINSLMKKECWMRFNSRVIMNNGEIKKILGVMMDVTDEILQKKVLESELKFINNLIENLPNPFFYKTKNGFYKFVNRHFEEFIGIKSDDILDKTVFEIASKDLADIYNKADMDLLSSGGVQVYESKVERPDGSIRNVVFTKSVHNDSDGNPLGILGLIEDISEKKKVEDEIRKIQITKEVFNDINKKLMNYDTERDFLNDVLVKFQDVYENSDFAILLKINDEGILSLYDSRGVQFVNEAMKIDFDKTYIYAAMKEDFNRSHIIDDIKIEDFPADDPGLMIVKKNDIKSNVFVPVNINSDLRWIFVFSSKSKGQYSKYDSLSEYIRSEIDIMVRSYRLYRKTLVMSRYDYMTGLMNRRYFEECFEIELKNQDKKFFVVLVDMDGLKKVNDYLGHQKGDFYIRLLCNFLISEFDEDCYFGRIGGDEFVGKISGMSKDQLINKLEFIKSEYKNVMAKDTENELIHGFSYGISDSKIDGSTINVLVKKADDRMYKNKRSV